MEPIRRDYYMAAIVRKAYISNFVSAKLRLNYIVIYHIILIRQYFAQFTIEIIMSVLRLFWALMS